MKVKVTLYVAGKVFDEIVYSMQIMMMQKRLH